MLVKTKFDSFYILYLKQLLVQMVLLHKYHGLRKAFSQISVNKQQVSIVTTQTI